ncbi:MAG: hypothetical protein GY856_04435, partial [bacterium]|nr:hypothetical protein [bacterium]
MTLRQDIQDHLADCDFDAVEDAWLVHIEEQPHDMDFFTKVARALDRAGEPERARLLLELYDDQVSAAGRWNDRLELLRRVGDLLLDPVDLHPAILATLGELYGDRPSYEQMAEKVGLRRATDDIPKGWRKADRLADLMAFDLGTIVHLEGKGAGRVVEVNMELESFKVHFDQHGDLRVGFGGAAKLLKPLLPGHILRRRLEEPEVLEHLRDEEPTALLRAVLESYPEPRTGAEIRRDLTGIVQEAKWNSWWTAARKHPQLLTAPGKRRAYTWAASSRDAQAAVWQSFEKADPRTQLGLMRRNAERDAELASRMSKVLVQAAGQVVDEDPGLA